MRGREALAALAPGQIWIVRKEIIRAGLEQETPEHIILLAVPPPHWVTAYRNPRRLVRTPLKIGERIPGADADILDDLHYLAHHRPMMHKHWTFNLLKEGADRLIYERLVHTWRLS